MFDLPPAVGKSGDKGRRGIPLTIKLKMRIFLLHLVTMLFLTLTLPAQGGASPPEYTYQVVNVFPHDPTAFTQGLVYKDGYFYEGTRLNGKSSLRKVRITTGEVVQHADLAQEFFGEGIAVVGDEVLQLTWTG